MYAFWSKMIQLQNEPIAIPNPTAHIIIRQLPNTPIMVNAFITPIISPEVDVTRQHHAGMAFGRDMSILTDTLKL